MTTRAAATGAALRAAMPGILLVAPRMIILLAFYVIPFAGMLRESFGAWTGDPMLASAW